MEESTDVWCCGGSGDVRRILGSFCVINQFKHLIIGNPLR